MTSWPPATVARLVEPPTQSEPASAATTNGEIPLTKKQMKRLLGAERPFDAWERYRALNDAIGEAYDLIDVHNREARFALILLGGLNAFVVIVATRSDLVASLDGGPRVWASTLLVMYAMVAVVFLLEAIQALRPGRFRPDLEGWPADSPDHPKRIRYFEDVVLRDVHSHWRAWCEVRVEQLNAELAIQLHSLSRKNLARQSSLRRLYIGLRLMTLLVSVILSLLVYGVWT